jgi:hypothetical protein
MDRTLRIPDGSADSVSAALLSGMEAREIHFENEKSQIYEAVDQLLDVSRVLKDKEREHKRDIEGLESRMIELKQKIRAYAEQTGNKRITGDRAIVEFTPSTSRHIDSEKFLKFLKSIGRLSEFWGYCKVPLKGPENDFGAAVLESNGVMSISVDEFGNMRIKSNGQAA